MVDDSTTRHIDVTEKADVEELLVRKNTNINKDLNVLENTSLNKTSSNELSVRDVLQIPLGAPQTRKTGDIWYDANITSPGGTSGGGETTRSITVHQYSDDVSMYDGSTHVASFSADNTINDIALDGRTIKIPKGVILGNMNGSDSIDLEKNVSTNTVKISVKDAYINNLADIRASLAVTPVSEELTALKDQHSVDVNNLTGSIASANSRIDSEKATLNASISSVNSTLTTRLATLEARVSSKIQAAESTHDEIYNHLNTIFEDIDNISERIDNFEADQNAKHSALGTVQDEMLERLLAIDGDNDASLKSQVATLNESLAGLSASLNSVSSEVTKIKNKINSIHGQGTI